MTNPVILLGTQSNGETLPVQVNALGQLVAEGLPGTDGAPGAQGPEGPEGPEGPQGPQGEPGESVELPPDPYEGALLGWLNGELSWVGTPPVPIPEGVFGPITDYVSENGYIEVHGSIPDTVGSGVYIYQCNERGTFFTAGWNVSAVWSAGVGTENIFDGDFDTYLLITSFPRTVTEVSFIINSSVEILSNDGVYVTTAIINGVECPVPYDGGSPIIWRSCDLSGLSLPVTVTSFLIDYGGGSNNYHGIKVDGKPLVDTDKSLGMRVNQVLGNAVIGVATADVDFTVGAYLRVPEQRVAPWVLYGNDPTSLIDHLRSS